MQRLIFTLLYDRGKFMLSRNFRLQQVGDVHWLFRNYDFATVSRGLDELMVLDVSRGDRDTEQFQDTVRKIAGHCFIPLTVGGGINDLELARQYMRCGADKLLLNSAFADKPDLVADLARHYGRQCIVAGIDFRTEDSGRHTVCVGNGNRQVDQDLPAWIQWAQQCGAGEILLQSMDRDGTGMGMDLSIVDRVNLDLETPCILMGGIGKSSHIVEGLHAPGVDAVATANLFNFIGNTFLDSRNELLRSGLQLPTWDAGDFRQLSGFFQLSKAG